MTKIVKQEQIAEVADALQRGEVVAFPTETVYGVGVKFGDPKALEKLFIAKNRDHSKAITLMLSHIEEIEKYAYVDEKIMNVARTFMPGRITLVLKKKENVAEAMTNGLPTIGIRIPDSPFVLDLIDRCGALSVTSANLSGHGNTSSTQEVLEQLDGRIDLVVEGHSHSLVASTVVMLTDGQVKVLREGEITEKEIKEAFR
ncbi:L-threonylcarbamoyladenylate synthase [Intestinibaculum porci]|jgi:L-threonylcarbamoyladenylate synthase|uniref:L-threonylcarbamoyladenylate synthase n=1 Tax=Intestinibaculum porci TaxID=2487118 RepID=A0A3G9JYG6_9FIRM|nr:L-threonylcarbamoyladenylate synthase [Intestinibaculum porci]MDD6349114.1 L-threonylcarbamoyladenylate synthase [Intestinibaculum porci]MDD6421556.1 L-threonylcarbamoyladenylate synthase [Intestinibaculum porci]BBH28049.1 threonylcarbamoyl-AMP synthase [Intestinibaculum porci]HAN58745.1 threonylcarbamoyl-AMP synthase [Erysipelotrichaceae bacterium]